MDAACLGLATPLDGKPFPLLASRLLLLPDEDKGLAVKPLKPRGEIEGCLVRIEAQVREVGVVVIVEHVSSRRARTKDMFLTSDRSQSNARCHMRARARAVEPTAQRTSKVSPSKEREHSI